VEIKVLLVLPGHPAIPVLLVTKETLEQVAKLVQLVPQAVLVILVQQVLLEQVAARVR